MKTTLTERYISAVTRRLPATMQRDVSEELVASIADDIEARTAAGESAAVAEHAVLTALGDPDALAAGYADRPLHLLGPKYYLTWWRLLKLLWAIVPAVAVGGVLIAELLAGAALPTLIGSVLAAGIGAVVHVAFWTTIVFVILERTGADTGMRWSPDTLPEPQQSGASRSDLIGSLVFLAIAVGLLLWDRFVGILLFAFGGVDIGQGLDGQVTAVSLLDPALWPWWMSGLFVLIALEAAVAIAVYVRRRWTRMLAAVNTVLAVVFAASALYLLASERLLNPAFTAHVADISDIPAEVGPILMVLTGVGIAGIAVWDIIDGWRKARRP